jgi:hypothetical protein
VNLADQQHTVGGLLKLAESEPVYIRAADGKDFLLEPADEFDRKAAALGSSQRFLSFLKGRSADDQDNEAAAVAPLVGSTRRTRVPAFS